MHWRTAAVAEETNLLAEVSALEPERQGKHAGQCASAAMAHKEEGTRSCQVGDGCQRCIEDALVGILHDSGRGVQQVLACAQEPRAEMRFLLQPLNASGQLQMAQLL